MTSHRTRRTFLKATGVATLAITAGCTDDDGPRGDDGGGDDDGASDDTDDDAADTSDEYDFGDWFDNVDNYDGAHDFTGESEVLVENGTKDGIYIYEPAAIVVEPGTTVVWEWIDGQSHTVTDEDDAFDSGYIDGEGETWEYTFEEEGTYLYYCAPHRSLGQKGAVVVE